jgi:F0F1-type ATP synthase assembly protein I
MKQTIKPTGKNDKLGYTKWAGFGIEFCGVLGIFCYIGYKLDQHLNSSPWFLLTGFFVGFAGMLYMVLKETMNLHRK